MSADNENKPVVSYGRTRDGHLAALVGDDAFALLPARDEGFYVAKAWRLGRPIGDWTSADFHRQLEDPVTEATFREKVEETAEHQRQLAQFDRHSVAARQSTPWGLSQHATVYGDGIVAHMTASHGGFALATDRNARIHPMLRSTDGFYEEDCAWAAIPQAFPELFTDLERRDADTTLRNAYPDAWEAIHGKKIPPGASYAKDRRTFDTANTNRWVVISAILSRRHPGFVECIATPGGRRANRDNERRFLVAEDEYDIGKFGFVIDEARHEQYFGPSSFVGWIEPGPA